MSITIGSNIAALRALRSLDSATSSLADVFTRLSSGQRINKASDDAAGLSIASSLDTDSRISNVAIRNANDGISAINIIDSALDGQKQILFRMSELAEQSANGVYSNDQREALQLEYQALLEEFDRIAETTTFNGQKLLRNPDGGELQIQIGNDSSSNSVISIEKADSHSFAGTFVIISDLNGDGIVNSGDTGTPIKILRPEEYNTIQLSDGEKNSGIQYGIRNAIDSEGNELKLRILFSTIIQDIIGNPEDPITAFTVAVTGENEELGTIEGDSVSPSFPFADDTFSGTFTFGTATVDLSINFSNSVFTKDYIEPNAKPSMIGLTNVENDYSARFALDTVKNRIDEISNIQSEYGSLLNRLRISSETQSVKIEQNTAARSRIMDTDIASDAATLARNKILQSAATSILAQANLSPQLVLRLLS